MVLGLRNNSTVFEELEVSIVDLMVANGKIQIRAETVVSGTNP
jgi:hypothetical protein